MCGGGSLRKRETKNLDAAHISDDQTIVLVCAMMVERFFVAALLVLFPGLSTCSNPSRRRLQSNRSADLIIGQGQTHVIDTDITAGLILVEGTLRCPDNTTVLTIETEGIVVAGSGAEFRCGTSSSPFRGELTITLTGDRDASQIYGGSQLGTRAIVATNAGVISLHGKAGKQGFQLLQATANPGNVEIRVEDASGWEIGDEIVIAPTNYNPNEAEERSITGISADRKRVTLNAGLSYKHWGSVQQYQNGKGQAWILDERAEVFNLRRNIRIMSVTSDNRGGHMIVEGSSSAAYVDNVEFYRMGQTGLTGRYPFHWHLKGNVSGQYIKNSSIHKSFSRCVVVHQTSYARVEGNTCFDHFGHGFFLEDGNEVKNQLVNNLGVLSKKPAPENALLASDIGNGQNLSRFPSPCTFWISHPDNLVRGNRAVGSEGSGFWMAFVTETQAGVSPSATPVRSNTWIFDDNVAHTCLVGITHDGAPNGPSTNNPRNSRDREMTTAHYAPSQVPTFKNLVAYKCSEAAIYFRGNRAIYQNTILADSGLGAFVAYDQELIDSLIVGVSQNTPPADGKNRHFCGVPVYDGPFWLEKVHFAGFSNLPSSVTASPIDLLFGGTEAFTNQVQGLTFDDPGADRIRLPYDKSNWADSHGASVRDIDGSLTGMPGRIVVSDHPMMNDRRCSPGKGGTRTLLCNYELGYVRIEDTTNSDATFVDFTTTRQALGNGATTTFDPKQNIPNNKFPVILGDDYQYVVTDLALPIGQRYRLHFYTMNIQMESPVIEFRGVRESCKICGTSDWYVASNGSGYSLFVTLKTTDAPANKRSDTFRGRSSVELFCSSESEWPLQNMCDMLCFSSANSVEVKGKGSIPLDSVKIGDAVRVGTGQFSRVFSFIHLDRTTEAEFLQIYAESLKTPLEVTPSHMIFVEDTPIRASEVKVGDRLSGNKKVTKITSVQRRGIFAPVTESGEIVVSGVLSSCYAAIFSHTPSHQHFGAHVLLAGRRLVCSFNFGFCKNEKYSVDGLPMWIPSSLVYFFVDIEKGFSMVHLFVAAVLMPVIMAVYLLEVIVRYTGVVIGLVVGLFAYKKITTKPSKMVC